MSTQPMMFKPRNAFYEALAQIEQRQDGLTSRVEAIGLVMPPPDAIENAIAGLAAPLGALGDTIAKSSANGTAAATRVAIEAEKAVPALDRLAKAHGRLVRLLEIERCPDRRAPVSRLFLGVNVDGSFTRNSDLGEMLIAASGGAAGLTMDPPTKKKRVTREEFVEAGMRHAEAHGFTDLSPEDFEEFFDQAPHVLKAIRQGAAPPPASAAH